MKSVDFNYRGINTTIQAKETESMEEICKNFCTKVEKDINSFFFLYGGNIVNKKLKFDEIASELDKERKKMNILVVEAEPDIDSNTLKEIKHVVCPICKENCRLNIDNYKVKLFECINGHPSNTILLNEYDLTTKVEQSDIKCGICKENDKGNAYNNLFYICLNCKINLCPLCKSSHDKEHNIIDYDDKNYVCDKHNELFNSYCNSCKKNLCILCEKEHINHHIISYSQVISEKESKLEELKIFKDTISSLKGEVKTIIKDLNLFLENVDTIYNINSSIINHYDIKKRNYQTLTNLNDLKINILKNEINSIVNCKGKGKKCTKIFDIYEKMINKTNNEIKNIERIRKIKEKIGEPNAKNEITLYYSSKKEKINYLALPLLKTILIIA